MCVCCKCVSAVCCNCVSAVKNVFVKELNNFLPFPARNYSILSQKHLTCIHQLQSLHTPKRHYILCQAVHPCPPRQGYDHRNDTTTRKSTTLLIPQEDNWPLNPTSDRNKHTSQHQQWSESQVSWHLITSVVYDTKPHTWVHTQTYKSQPNTSCDVGINKTFTLWAGQQHDARGLWCQELASKLLNACWWYFAWGLYTLRMTVVECLSQAKIYTNCVMTSYPEVI